ncbi:hypothetical protein CKF54_01380 [Psittacicella hinzii]|uniref:DNA mismatch repair MutH/Type II restriction enzyme Sau3AI domain-containing protein n=1 Tax=Psittacicella hinzii TaxID=2028575 RepID=A0A3A1Y8W3_9GAMM|nr:DNA mismatch repair protein MutH [Psittacicella hinzii]RIY34115.1 hypothetical protein CKF54_01380 [Psittacicella hinzii]
MKNSNWQIDSRFQASSTEKLQYKLENNSLKAHQASKLMQREFNLDLELHTSLFAKQVTPSPAPKSLAELLCYCDNISGKTLEEVATRHNVEMIYTLQENRGWIGNLIEIALGAVAGSKPTQDFANLGVELKTLAINAKGEAKNDIFVSSLPINGYMMQSWENSHLLYKLKKILFVPIEADPSIPLKQRRIGKAFFWSPTIQELQTLKQDWQTIMNFITLQDFEQLKGNIGNILCVRIKALNRNQSISSKDVDGFKINLAPLSFYLRRSFINQIL